MINTNLDLQDLVENDSPKSKMKNVAKLFLVAMNDWPTENQTLISEFISELKDYFGSPLKPQNILKKNVNFHIANNFWKHESGTSIVEMIAYSKVHFDEDDFDKIVLNMTNYFSDKRASR